MSEYKYQLHCHTAPCSACSMMSPQELARTLRDSGYSGACITNHFFNGNSGIDRSLSWEDFVGAYEKDYLECKKYADPLDVDVIFGIEEGVGGGLEILCYGVTPDMLRAHPELREKNPRIWYEALSPLGVLIIQAHPFRERSYITTPGILPLELIDGFEVYNSENKPEANQRAKEFAELHGELILTSGADSHKPANLACGGISSPCRIRTPEQLTAVLRSGDYKVLYD